MAPHERTLPRTSAFEKGPWLCSQSPPARILPATPPPAGGGGRTSAAQDREAPRDGWGWGEKMDRKTNWERRHKATEETAGERWHGYPGHPPPNHPPTCGCSGQALAGPRPPGRPPAQARGWGLSLREQRELASWGGSVWGQGPQWSTKAWRGSDTCGSPGSVCSGGSSGEVSASVQRK